MTDRQIAVLREIARLSEELGRPPSYREVGAEMGIRSPNGVREHVGCLRAQGWVRLHSPEVKYEGIHLTGLRWIAVYTDDEAGRKLEELLARTEVTGDD